MRTKRIAGVSVNLDCLPSRKTLVERALKTREFIYKRDALKLINKEIDGSKLFKKTDPKPKTEKKSAAKDNRGTDNNKQS